MFRVVFVINCSEKANQVKFLHLRLNRLVLFGRTSFAPQIKQSTRRSIRSRAAAYVA